MPLYIEDFYERPEEFLTLCKTAILRNPWHTRTAMENGGIQDTCHEVWLETVRMKPPPDDLAFSTAIYHKTRWTILRIRKSQSKHLPIEGDSTVSEEGVEHDLDSIIDNKETVKALMRTLKERDRKVIETRFGLSPGGRPMTLEKTGKLLGMTRERIRQIESKALKRMERQAEILNLPNLRNH